MRHRLVAALMLLACLLGIVQPGLACASHGDCCSTGSPVGCAAELRLAAAVSGFADCCATRAPAATSSTAVSAQSRQDLDRTSGSAVAPVVIIAAPALQHPVPTRRIATIGRIDQSQTFLLTARLRL